MALRTRDDLFTGALLAGLLLKHNVLMLHVLGVLVPGTQMLRSIVLVALVYLLVRPATVRRRNRIAAVVIATGFTAFFLANLWYNRYFGNYLSFSEVAAGESFDAVGVLFRHIMRITDVVFVLDIIVMAATGRWRTPASSAASSRVRSVTWLRPGGAPGAALSRGARAAIIVAAAFLLLAQGVIANRRLGGKSPTELYLESTPAFTGVYGVLPLYAAEMILLLTGPPDTTEAVTPVPPAEMAVELDEEALLEPPTNVIVIQVESLDKKLINYRHNGVEVTPFVNSLVEKGLYGTNFYAQHVNGSFDADFSLLTGMYPVNRHFTFRDHEMTLFPSLVEILRDRGYRTMAFHGNDGDFFNRNEAYAELGFDRFYSLDDFDLQDRTYTLDHSHLGINDYDFLRQALTYLEEAQNPFFAFLITVTSHTPFTFYPEEYRVEAFETILNPLVRDFFNSVRFVDSALEMFFLGLEERGLTEDTLIIIYSDHEAAIQTPVYTSSVNFQVNRNIKEPEHIPLLILHPDIEPGTLHKTGSITDLAPTILDFLGIDAAPPEFMGGSLMDPREIPVLFIHELPLVLYRDQLFAAEIGTLNRIGHIESRETDIPIPPEQELLVLEKIRYSREVMMKRRRFR